MALTRTCKICPTEFQTYPSWDKRFCSRSCATKWTYDQGLTSRAGAKWLPKSRDKIASENNWGWHGDEVGYSGLHNWVRRKLGSPDFCAQCGDDNATRYEWANVSWEYQRDLDDYMRLCRSCHTKYDRYAGVT